MILPTGAVIDEAAGTEAQPSRTYKLDLAAGRIAGVIDELDAVRQAVYKILDTERFAHFIYSANYGSESNRSGDASIELKRWLTEALLQDDRINEVSDFAFGIVGDAATVALTVHSIFGSATIERGI
ncbi:DUF2634 domain-containing protein [Paenibacillus glycinis]|uniref:DUF2634 domain-containing protein n=1 Tax=Paenibacillus glycinis TaxID=2697035 RepID=A0ABW9XNW5_9BACL|nr:DUF2634 domain-containing protein [Paenibacillus glycinis]NBD24316.1 DUF2634 domain-containing protein [Paenibacillus glycinis]